MNPTKEQIQWLWEQCGLKWFWNHNPKCHCGAIDNDDSMRSWHYKDGDDWNLATRFWHEDMVIDLNNLFKYAVPFLEEIGWSLSLAYDRYEKIWRAELYHEDTETWITMQHKDPALALFWAIYKTLEGVKC